MDCLSFRRFALTHPTDTNPEVLQHLGECIERCDEFRREVRRREQFVRQAVNLPVPEGLQARILLRQSNVTERITPARWLSLLAACLVFAVAIGAGLYGWNQPIEWHQAVTDYMEEPFATGNPSKSIKAKEVNILLRDLGVQLSANIGQITSAKPCLIGRRKGAHLVISGNYGPVSILVMPEAEIDGPVMLKTRTMSGMLAPCPRGSVAFFGPSDQSVAHTMQRFERSATFL